MPKYNPLPPLERLNELLEVVEIPEDKYGEWSGLVWKVKRNGTKGVGSVAGWKQKHSLNPTRIDWKVKVGAVDYFASRVIYYMVHYKPPGDFQVDHEDQNPLNNNAWNLRLDVDGCIQKVNNPLCRNNTSGITGVCWHKATGKWQADVRFKGKRKYIGLYTCKIEAACAVRDKWIALEWDKLGRKLPDLDKIQCDCGTCK